MTSPFGRRSVLWCSVLLVVGIAPMASAQAQQSLAAIRARYETAKVAARPAEAVRPQIEALDRQLKDAVRLGRTGEARRLLAKGLTLLAGREWTDEDDYDESIVLRADRVFIDTSAPYRVRLEQYYAPEITLPEPLTGRVVLRPLLAQSPLQPERYDLRTLDDVPRDLGESPLAMEFDLSGIPDGPYVLELDVQDAGELLGSAALRVWLLKGLDARVRELESAAASAPEPLRGDIRYPGDMVRKIDRGLADMGRFDLVKELDAAAAVAGAAASKTDPFEGKRGVIERHYVLAAAGEILPYRVHVPEAYTGRESWPLIVALHGRGVNEASLIDDYLRRLPALADEHGYLVVAPLGYRVDGFYGAGVDEHTDAETRRVRDLSERDVMAVVARMQRDYRVDERRVFLMGHSMGAVGAWHLAMAHPDLWAGAAAFAGSGFANGIARLRPVPQFVVHGARDATAPVGPVRTLVAEMKRLGVDVTYVEVPTGTHQDIVVPNLAAMFEFFDAHGKGAQPSRPRR
ncbi:MAG: prolyl oligopeptidase family serine peptidase [Vicinamibacterales bacterium]